METTLNSYHTIDTSIRNCKGENQCALTIAITFFSGVNAIIMCDREVPGKEIRARAKR